MKLSIYIKRTFVCLILGVICLITAACSSSEVEEEKQTQITPVDYCTTADINNMNFEYTSRDINAKYDDNVVNVTLEDGSATADGDGVLVSSQKISIDKDGTYVFSGNYSDGQIYVSGDNIKAQIVLDNAYITNSSGPAIYVEQANKVFVTLADGSNNILSDGLNYKDDLESYGVIFSKDDLCLNGSGELTINANYKHAINCNDDLTITGGIYNINAAKDGIRANDSVKIKYGQFKINSGSDCISSNNKNAEDKGYLVIDGGTFNLASVNEALKACTYIRINDGELNISAGDDALHNNVIIDINGGQLNIDAYDDAIHTESELNINDGNINITSCYEGLEAQMITVNGGEVSIVAADDSINASYAEWNTVSFEQQFENQGLQLETPEQQNKFDHRDMDMFYGDGGFGNQPGGVDPFSQGQMPQDQMSQGQDFGGGRVMNTGNGECKLIFNGGTVSVDSQGDGIDSNRDIEINGGTLLINGPADGGNSPIDYGEQGSCTVNGGKVIAVGSVGMFENFTGGKQPFGFVRANGNAGSSVSVENSSGKEINLLTATKAFQVILVSDFEFSEGQSYNIRVGSQSYSLSVSTTAQSTGMFDAFGQMPGGFFGEGTQPPSPYGNGGMPLKF